MQGTSTNRRSQLKLNLLILGILHQNLCSTLVLAGVVLLFLRQVGSRAHFALCGRTSSFGFYLGIHCSLPTALGSSGWWYCSVCTLSTSSGKPPAQMMLLVSSKHWYKKWHLQSFIVKFVKAMGWIYSQEDGRCGHARGTRQYKWQHYSLQ